MPYFVRIPRRVGQPGFEGDSESYLNIINGSGTLIQRELRRKGYGGYEPTTAATMCAVFDLLNRGEVFPRKDEAHFSFFDVGANGGLYSFLCKCLFRSACEVTAFEPAPDTFRWLEAINRANFLEIATVKAAVSDTTEDVTLYLSEKSDASNSLNENFKEKHKGTVKVPCVTLDGYIEETGRAPDFLKIDTESHEINVLRGARRHIETHRPTFIVEAIQKGDTDYGRQISEFFSQVGGYHYYHLTKGKMLTKHDTIFGQVDSEQRDWLVSPVEVPATFRGLARDWASELSLCAARTNIGPAKKAKPGKLPPPPKDSSGLLQRIQAAARTLKEG